MARGPAKTTSGTTTRRPAAKAAAGGSKTPSPRIRPAKIAEPAVEAAPPPAAAPAPSAVKTATARTAAPEKAAAPAARAAKPATPIAPAPPAPAPADAAAPPPPKAAPKTAPKTAAKTAPKAAPKAPPKILAAAGAQPAAKPAPTPEAAAPAAPPPPPPEPTAPPPAGATSAKPAEPAFALGDAPNPLGVLSPDQRKAMETLSVNLAKAAITAQGALAEAMLAKSEQATPDADPFHVAPAVTSVAGKLLLNPDKLMKAQADLFSRYIELWSTAARRAAGGEAPPVASPGRGDKRFLDPDWSTNPVFDLLKQSYLVTSDWLNGLVAQVEDVDPLTKRRVEFFTKMLTDAFSPSNFLASNPVALREAVATQGQSLLRGAERFAADLQRGGGRLAISQTDPSRFIVGENVATAPGKVIVRNELFELLQFNPSTDFVYETPLLIFPPWINKYYILDLRPENSMIRWLTAQGVTVFVASWVNPGPELADRTVEDYMYGGIYKAVDNVIAQTGAAKVNTVGYCIGGTLLSCALAHMAAKGDERIGAATFFAAQQDFTEAGDLLLFTDDAWLKDLEGRIDAAGGVSPAAAMADTFNALRANDLIWSFFVNNYLLGKDPAAFDLLFWNSDQTRMPRALHLSYIKDFYRDNRLAKGELVVGGERLELGRVKTPIYVQSSREDHIAPMRSVYRGARLFGGDVTFTLAGSGHIAGVINPPSANKYQHWTNPALPPTLEAWQAEATQAPGSWWPHWLAWLAARSGAMTAARDPEKGPFKPLEDAPGSYVKVRSPL